MLTAECGMLNERPKMITAFRRSSFSIQHSKLSIS